MSTAYVYAAPFLPSPVEQTGLSNSPQKRRPKKLVKKKIQFIAVFIFNLERNKGENSQLTSSVRGNKSSSIRENSGERLQHEVSEFCSAPSHSSDYCRKERFSPRFHLVYIGNEKKLNLPAVYCL